LDVDRARSGTALWVTPRENKGDRSSNGVPLCVLEETSRAEDHTHPTSSVFLAGGRVAVRGSKERRHTAKNKERRRENESDKALWVVRATARKLRNGTVGTTGSLNVLANQPAVRPDQHGYRCSSLCVALCGDWPCVHGSSNPRPQQHVSKRTHSCPIGLCCAFCVAGSSRNWPHTDRPEVIRVTREAAHQHAIHLVTVLVASPIEGATQSPPHSHVQQYSASPSSSVSSFMANLE
jgi:hypothetical protein